MIWIKLGLLLTAFLYAGFIPYIIKKSASHLNIDLKKQTLSFISNKRLFGIKYRRGYTRLLFFTAILHYLYFFLLTKIYDLGENEQIFTYLDYSFLFITLLAFVPHNIQPYSFRTLKPTLQRLIHNILAIFVFLSLPTLILIFQISVMEHSILLGISGLTISAGTVLVTLVSLFLNGINGFTELLFINGISFWTLLVTSLTLIL